MLLTLHLGIQMPKLFGLMSRSFARGPLFQPICCVEAWQQFCGAARLGGTD